MRSGIKSDAKRVTKDECEENTTRLSYIEQSIEIIDRNKQTLRNKNLSTSKSVVGEPKS